MMLAPLTSLMMAVDTRVSMEVIVANVSELFITYLRDLQPTCTGVKIQLLNDLMYAKTRVFQGSLFQETMTL